MDSSTSHFNAVPRRTVLLIATALVSWLACALYSLRLNPEVDHYRDGYAIKRAWAAQMTREHGSKIVVFGGSSCEFSLDGERLLANYGEPVVNAGLSAAMGAVVLTESALTDLRRGDTLIVAIEPDLLSVPMQAEPSLGVQFSFSVHHPEWVLHPQLGVGQINSVRAATDLRPGGYHAFTLLGKWMRREPLFRYQLRDYHPSGWAATPVRLSLSGEIYPVGSLSNDGRILLANLSHWCETNGVRVAYSLPWSYCSPDQTRVLQKWNAEFVASMMDYLPVLRDPALGADPVAADFADTPLHLTAAAAARRTDGFGREIQQWDLWTRESLKQATMELSAPAQAK